MNDVRVVQVVPFDPLTGYLTPIIHKRMGALMRDLYAIKNWEAVCRDIWRRVVSGDQHLAVLAALQGRHVVGHAVAEIVTVDLELVVFCHQCQSDIPQAVDMLVAWGDTWGKQIGAQKMRMEVLTNKPEAVWERVYRRHGFKVSSRVMERSIV